MLMASELRAGLAVRVGGAFYKVIEVTHHAGQGKMGGSTHAKLRHLDTGTTREWRFRPEEPVEEIRPERQNLQFLYRDDRLSHFMHPETFEQVDIENDRLGRAGAFLVESMTVPVEFVDAHPVGIVMPDIVELKVVDTPPPVRTHGDTNVWKEATLENGVKLMVPPFIATGEAIRVDVERGAYVERAHKK
jgi:elongation factor P